ncbi:hypothetical protein E5676_scaffold863G00680 [Cucumis melo var. makuwa]|uniref:Uncharacterized protein n=1 Tax=Cucumis melo var. makuwa TaxID=1194695 RepID=A0A5D3BXA1_CUCMM|nr:hypothetical protein E5676_scaffold863G00680 [Cucumis melo var. makuwa]
MGPFMLYPLLEGGGKPGPPSQFVMSEWNCFLQDLNVLLARHRNVCLMTREFLLHPPSKEKGCFCGLQGCGLCYEIFGRDTPKFLEVGGPSETWRLTTVH